VPPLHFDRARESVGVVKCEGMSRNQDEGRMMSDKQVINSSENCSDDVRPNVTWRRAPVRNSSVKLGQTARSGKFDLLGAQVFLYRGLEDTFSEKTIYAGDVVHYFSAEDSAAPDPIQC